MYFYSNPDDEKDPHKLTDAEVFEREDGWYFWFCTPGCLPESDEPWGPYPTQEDAIHACREMVNE